jgi:hypothetical protein
VDAPKPSTAAPAPTSSRKRERPDSPAPAPRPLSRRRILAAGAALPLAYATARLWPARAQNPSPSALGSSLESPHAVHTAGLTWNEALLHHQRDAFDYFLREANPVTGLIPDNVQVHRHARNKQAPASIAAIGFGLVAYVIGVERGYLSREEAAARTLATLRFFATAPHGPEPDATGYKGFYYHFLDMQTGRRAWQCELSTVDTAFLIGGMRSSAAYFNHDNAAEHEIRQLADDLYRRVDWQWATNPTGPAASPNNIAANGIAPDLAAGRNSHAFASTATVTHGWRPETGFIPYRWQGYDEALLLYVMGLGSPTYPLESESYAAWTSTYEWKTLYDHEFVYAGPLFIHQYSHMWIDFRGIQDAFMRDHDLDYFENSRRATLIQQQYAIANPLQFEGYGQHFWGLTASDGPAWTTKKINGIERTFYDYLARGAPFGPDDGTIAPWAVMASLPFAPDTVQATLENIQRNYPEMLDKYCFKCSFNPTFTAEDPAIPSWTSEFHFGINLGPIVTMVENHLTGLPWDLMRQCPYITSGLRKAGFQNGWLA